MKASDLDPEAIEDTVRHAVATALTDKQRETVELFYFEGLSQSEIARRLGVSQQVVQKRNYACGARDWSSGARSRGCGRCWRP